MEADGSGSGGHIYKEVGSQGAGEEGNLNMDLPDNSTAATNSMQTDKPSLGLTTPGTLNIPQLFNSIFRHIPEQEVHDFCMNLFPVFMGKSVLDGLDLAIKSLYQVKGNNSKGGKDFKDVIKAKAAEHGKIVKEAVMVLFSKEEYLQYLKETAKSDAALGNGVIDITGEATGGRSVRTVPPKKPVQHHKATRSDPKRVHSIAKETSSDLDRVMNLTSKGICICDQVVIPLDDTFICVHCNYCYHYSCMKQKSKAKHCSYCYLSKMLPNKEVKKTLFIGLLKKGIKKHQFSIKLQGEDLTKKYRLQVRCLRLKDSTYNFMLFPDSFEMQVNNYSVKQLEPIHRQSSLKYRKDEAFNVDLKHLQLGENKVTMLEKHASRDLKDVRIEADYHVIGLFIVEEKRVEQLVQEIVQTAMTSKEESTELLDSCFIHSKQEDEVTCDVVKIPLLCHLTSQKLRIPVRGLFCNHYLCFDLYSFLLMTAKSPTLRWNCPECKLPCYRFRVDSVLLAILSQYEQHSVSEVMFFRTGAYSVSTGEGYVQEETSQIEDLEIEAVGKRMASQLVEAGTTTKSKKRVGCVPEQSQVIQLD